MRYVVKEIYYTLQGEGVHTGRPAVFCRFTGCNLWSGREADRSTAMCSFCDTDFLGVNGPNGGNFETADELAESVDSQWPSDANGRSRKLVVCTGGEPLLQMDDECVDALQRRGFEVAIETNGTRTPPAQVDWVCVSPKVGAKCILTTGDEFKLVYPQVGCDPADYAEFDFDYFYLQPMDGPKLQENIALATEYCMTYPQWKLSLQTHKLIGIR